MSVEQSHGTCGICGKPIIGRDIAEVCIENYSNRGIATARCAWNFKVCQECLEKILPPCFKGDVQ